MEESRKDEDAINMQEQDKVRIQEQTIDRLRFPLAIFVIMHHVLDKVIPVLTDFNLFDIRLAHFTGDDFYHIFRVFFDTVRGICNPGFFLLSGYLFFKNVKVWNKDTYIAKLKKRVFTYLIPYLLWNVIATFTIPIQLIAGRIIKQDGDWNRIAEYFLEIHDKGVWNIFWHFNTWGETNINILGHSAPRLGPMSIPMWFLQTLICLSIITPLIYLLIRYLKIWGVVLLGVLAYTGIWFLVPGFGIEPIFYFTLGAYFGINKKNMVFELRHLRFIIVPFTIVSFIAKVYFDYSGTVDFNYAKSLFILGATLSMVILCSYIVETKHGKPNKALSNACFFIYASHSPLLIVSGVSVLYEYATFHSKAWYVLTIGYIAVPVITAYLCYAGYLILKKICNPVAKLLAGYR